MSAFKTNISKVRERNMWDAFHKFDAGNEEKASWMHKVKN